MNFFIIIPFTVFFRARRKLIMERLLFEDDDVELYYFDAKSDVFIITFSEMGRSAGVGAWGGDALRKVGLSYAGFVSKRPNWFPSDSVSAGHDVLRTLMPAGLKVMLYGHSQGGYAAFRYASLFSARCILSFCPQYSILEESLGGLDDRYSRYLGFSHRHRAIEIDDVPPSTLIYMFYDPSHLLDKLNAAALKSIFPQTNEMKVFGLGHRVVRVISRSSVLSSVIDCAIKFDCASLRQTIRASKRLMPLRRLCLANEILVRNRNVSMQLIDAHEGSISKELAGDLVSQLVTSGEYLFLATRADRFWLNGDEHVKKAIILSMLIMDRLCSAMEYSLVWYWCGKGDRFAIRAMVGAIHRCLSGIIDMNFVSDTGKFLYGQFGEGWHSPESWGCWGGAIRSRLFLSDEAAGGKIDGFRIPVSVYRPELQSLSVKCYAGGEWRDVDVTNSFVDIDMSSGPVVLDFLVDKVYSPAWERVSLDGRAFGFKLLDASRWTVVFSEK